MIQTVILSSQANIPAVRFGSAVVKAKAVLPKNSVLREKKGIQKRYSDFENKIPRNTKESSEYSKI